jgi:hypothetical protein
VVKIFLTQKLSGLGEWIECCNGLINARKETGTE